MRGKSQTFSIILYVNIVPHLVINTKRNFLNTTHISQSPIENDIHKYENHPSVIAIKNI